MFKKFRVNNHSAWLAKTKLLLHNVILGTEQNQEFSFREWEEERALVLFKLCSAAAKTLVCYPHCFTPKTKHSTRQAAANSINSSPGRPTTNSYQPWTTWKRGSAATPGVFPGCFGHAFPVMHTCTSPWQMVPSTLLEVVLRKESTSWVCCCLLELITSSLNAIKKLYWTFSSSFHSWRELRF